MSLGLCVSELLWLCFLAPGGVQGLRVCVCVCMCVCAERVCVAQGLCVCVCVCRVCLCCCVCWEGVLHFLCAEGLTLAALSTAVWVGLCCRWVGSHLAPTLRVAEKGVVGVKSLVMAQY